MFRGEVWPQIPTPSTPFPPRDSGPLFVPRALTQLLPDHRRDIGGILGVFGAAINYLVIRTRKQSQQYKTEEWWRLQQTIARLLQAYAD